VLGHGPHGPEGQSLILTPVDLKLLGLTPGSTVWRSLLENGETEERVDHQGTPLIWPSP
jgi:hypothetical protein